MISIEIGAVDLLSVAGERGINSPPVDGSAIGDPVLRRRSPTLTVPRLEPVGREAVPLIRREGVLPLLRHLRRTTLGGAVGDPGAELILNGGSRAVLGVDVHGVVLRMSGSVARLNIV